MTNKTYRVFFTRSACGPEGAKIAPLLKEAFDEQGSNLPVIQLGDDDYQVRDLVLTGSVWRGVFAKLRDDAPHIVDANDDESEIDLDEGDRLIDKCHFMLRSRTDVLVWQNNRSAGSLNKFASYWSQLFDSVVTLPHVMNQDELEEKLRGQLYEITFAYDRPNQLNEDAPSWNHNAFDMMDNVHAAHAKFSLRAPRGGGLAAAAKTMVRRMAGSVNGFEKIRIRLTDETEPIEIFMAPLKDSITVQLLGRYPDPQAVYEELSAAFDRKKASIPARDAEQ